jgi:hypothetical protein
MGVLVTLVSKLGLKALARKAAGRAILAASMLSNLFLPQLLRSPKAPPFVEVIETDPWYVVLVKDVELWGILCLLALALVVTSPAFDKRSVEKEKVKEKEKEKEKEKDN